MTVFQMNLPTMAEPNLNALCVHVELRCQLAQDERFIQILDWSRKGRDATHRASLTR